MARLVNGFAGLGLAAAVLLVGKGGHAQSALPTGWLESRTDESGRRCELKAEQSLEKTVLLACGAAGVWEVALEEAGPRLVRSLAFEGDVVGFVAEADGRLWVKVQSLTARPLSAGQRAGSAQFPEEARPPSPLPPRPELVPNAPPAPKPQPVEVAPRQAVGKVERVAKSDVLISLGEVDGLSRGDRVELYWPADTEEPDAADELVAIGVVTSLTERTAKVRIGLNERVEPGALARPTRAQASASLAAPPRVGGMWSLEAMARPFAAMEELGGGLLLSASVGRRFASHFALRAVLDPVAIADVESNDAISAANFTFLGTYDSQYFEMGLGFGGQSVNEPTLFLPPGSGLAVSQFLRLGALDGLNISARTSIVLFHSQFDFGGMVATGQIPVSRGLWLILGGGGGDVGYGYGEFGLRALMSGNGFSGSKYITVTAGGAGVFEAAACDPFGFCSARSYAGPMAGFGVEWRL